MRAPAFPGSYRIEKQPLIRPKTQVTDDSRIQICSQIVKPRTLQQMATKESLAKVRDTLLSRGSPATGRSLSPRSVQSYLLTMVSCLNWANEKGWLGQRVSSPLDANEVRRFLAAVAEECPHDPVGWTQLAQVQLWMGLRLNEAMVLSHDKNTDIRIFHDEITFSGRVQKNGQKQSIPIVSPEFLDLISSQRIGFVVDLVGQKGQRPTTPYAGRVLARAGRRAGIVVSGSGKSASAHDLRRTCLQNWADDGVAPADLQHLARHASLDVTQKYYIKKNNSVLRDRVFQVQNRYTIP